jgi:hypothetical protein
MMLESKEDNSEAVSNTVLVCLVHMECLKHEGQVLTIRSKLELVTNVRSMTSQVLTTVAMNITVY